MFRAIGYVFMVLAIGTIAIAWSDGPQKQTGPRSETLTPDRYHLKAGSLPVQTVSDMTFVFANED